MLPPLSSRLRKNIVEKPSRSLPSKVKGLASWIFPLLHKHNRVLHFATKTPLVHCPTETVTDFNHYKLIIKTDIIIIIVHSTRFWWSDDDDQLIMLFFTHRLNEMVNWLPVTNIFLQLGDCNKCAKNRVKYGILMAILYLITHIAALCKLPKNALNKPFVMMFSCVWYVTIMTLPYMQLK